MRRLLGILAISVSLAAVIFFGTGAVGDRGVTRVYYVGADEVDWDFVPIGSDVLSGNPVGQQYLVTGLRDTVIATRFKKAVYQEYTDSTFTQLKPRPPEMEHTGILGPILRGEVGDTIVVVFKNQTTLPVSVHPHGVFYDKDSEGAPYIDGTDDKHDDGVPSGEIHRYVWPVPERAGPGPNQPNSIVWPYHSHTREVKDVNSGLIGAMIITRDGMGDADGKPTDVDREFVMLFGAFIENTTNYTPENLRRYTGDTATIGPNGPRGFFRFGYAAINGFMYGNLPLSSMTMDEGDRVRWYLFSATSFDDFHTPTWHGHTVLINNRRVDVADLSGPLLMLTADMVADNPGVWEFHCHFGEHMEGGMTARYEVRAAGTP